ncbi:iron chaperone [Deminuibacter soli]|uniref:DUF1801 domain-containing protein n=1 Tax=Deminuibacter soli TaxID=2291815 RepID=A0A3E1NGT4_9BACT|nr:DUF1801 domain-containing protein [Deminuibacter soli]RFM27163.1 DUF1801 domain-containing protein [Deminuibacter soli]
MSTMPAAKQTPVQTVDDYIALAPVAMREALTTLRNNILAAVPKAEELISYQVPTYKQNGALVHFAAFAKHCSLIVVNKDLLVFFEKELQGFKTNGATIRFTPGKQLPATLVKKILQQRIKENAARMK